MYARSTPLDPVCILEKHTSALGERHERATAAEDAVRKYVQERMKEVDEVKQRVDFMYWRIVERFFEQKTREESQGSGSTSTNKKG